MMIVMIGASIVVGFALGFVMADARTQALKKLVLSSKRLRDLKKEVMKDEDDG